MLKKFIFVMICGQRRRCWCATTRSRACSVCLTGTAIGDEGSNASVLFLMATPYAVVGSIVGGLIFTYRRALKNREKAELGTVVIRVETGGQR